LYFFITYSFTFIYSCYHLLNADIVQNVGVLQHVHIASYMDTLCAAKYGSGQHNDSSIRHSSIQKSLHIPSHCLRSIMQKLYTKTKMWLQCTKYYQTSVWLHELPILDAMLALLQEANMLNNIHFKKVTT